ncbi:porin family protein [Rhodobacteraceae bacterium SC52]|nr:porin family protein [Rhodobacteraceae bacterium SC52]
MHTFRPPFKTVRRFCAIAVFLGAQGAAQAQEPGEFGINLGVSTLGPTIEGTYRISDKLGVRVPAGYFGGDFDTSEDGIDYDLNASIGGIGLLADYYPLSGGLRLSGGAFLSKYEADGTGQGSGQIGDTIYNDIDLAFDAEAENYVMPTLSLGYDGSIGQRWTLSADLGAMYTGGFDVTLQDRSGQVSQSDIDAEIANIEGDAPDFIPYVKLSVGFRF